MQDPVCSVAGTGEAWIASRSWDNSIRFWDPRGDDLLKIESHGTIFSMAFSPIVGDKYFFATTSSDSVSIWTYKVLRINP